MSHTIEARKKISEALRRQWKDGTRKNNDYLFTEEVNRKRALSNIGRTSPMKGKKQTEKWKEHIKKFITGKNSKRWKGDQVGYRGLHSWVHLWKGKPNKCEMCGIEKIGRDMHWANVSRTYLRDLTDWISLCASCHGSYDKRRRETVYFH
jgi:hypothetical protein